MTIIDSAPIVEAIIGRLPNFWMRRAIYLANLQSLFFGNEDQTESLRREIKAVPTYGGRLLPIVDLLFRKGDNLLVVENPPDEALVRYFTQDLGLTVPDFIVAAPHVYQRGMDSFSSDGEVEVEEFHGRLKMKKAEWIDGFVTDAGLAELAQLLGARTISTLEGSRRGNNKLLLHRFLLERGFPMFETKFAQDEAEVQEFTDGFLSDGYRKVVVKSQIGASGIGMVELNSTDRSDPDIPTYMFHEGPCLVQGWLEDGVKGVRRIGSPSVQLFVGEEKVQLYDLTDQILRDEKIHEGNVAPPSYLEKIKGLKADLLEKAAETGVWLHRGGYRGTASVDFLVVDRGGEVEAIVCEINARVTGATYPSVLARHFHPSGTWLMRNLRFEEPLGSEEILSALDDSRLLFRPGEEKKVLPINFNHNQDDLVAKGQFLCLARDGSGCLETLAAIEGTLPVKSAYDRD